MANSSISTSTSPPATFRERSPSLVNGTDTTTFFPEPDSQVLNSTNTDKTSDSNDESPSHSNSNSLHSNSLPPPSNPQTSSLSQPLSQLTSQTLEPQPQTHTLTSPDNTIQILLTHTPLSLPAASNHTRTPTAGATVLFLGTTRSYFRDPSRPVSHLTYTSYAPLALQTLLSLATSVQKTHGLERVYIAHRLGDVAVGEESIVVAVSAGHRGPAWRGAEELLERVKERAEIWKREWFVDGGVEIGRDGEQGRVEREGGMSEERGKEEGEVSREAKGGVVGVWRDNRESDSMGRRKEGIDKAEGVKGS